MKKIILICLVSLALYGCGEKKNTEEMLVGNWKCDLTQQVANWKNGTFQDYGEPESKKLTVVYKIYDGVIIKSRLNNTPRQSAVIELWESEPTYRAIHNLKKIVVDNNFVTSIESKLDYISENEYKLTEVITKIYGDFTELEQERSNNKVKFEEHCTKIKTD